MEKIQVGIEFIGDTSKVRREIANISRPIVKNLELNFDKRPLGTITSSFTQFDKSLDAATARVLAFAGTTSVIYGMGAAVRRVVKDFISVEAAMTSVQSITKSTSEEMKAFTNEAFALANATSTSFSDVAASMQEFARQGLSLEKVSKATAAALTISKLSATDLKQTIDGLVATSNSFANELLDYTEIANTLVAVDAKFATSAGGLIEGIKRVGAVAADAGLEFKELVATIAGVKQVSGRSEAIIGNGLKTIITNLQTDRVQRELEGIGIATKNAAGEFLPLLDVIKQFSNIYNKLDDSKIADITQKIAGKYQINQFKALVTAAKGGDSSIISRGINVANQDTDEAKTRLELIGKTTESELIKLNNSLTQFGAQVGGKIAKPVIDELSRIANEGIDIFSKAFGDNNPIGNVIANGITGILKGPGIIIAFNTIYKLIARIGKEAGQAISSVGQLGSKEKNNLIINQELIRLLQQQNNERLAAIKHTNDLAVKQKALSEIIAGSTKPAPVPVNPQFNYAPILSRKDRATLLTRGLNRTAAEGHIPAIQSEQSAIGAGVGGARPHAKPVVRKLNLAGGTENAVVNTDEYIVRNYMGSKKDAVFNQDMIRKAGGASKLKSFGNVEKVFAGGSIPNLAIKTVYRGFNPNESLSGLHGPLKKPIDTNIASTASNALRSLTVADFLERSTLESLVRQNIGGMTNSTSLSPSAAFRFGSNAGEFHGLAQDKVRVLSPKVLGRYSNSYKKKGNLVPIGRQLYNLASRKPFGIDASEAYSYVQSKTIGDLVSGMRRNPYPIEREVNIVDPSAQVFTGKNAVVADKTGPKEFTKSLDHLSSRLFGKKYRNRMEDASDTAYPEYGPYDRRTVISDKYRKKIDKLVLKSFYGQDVKFNENQKYFRAGDKRKQEEFNDFEQIASGYIPNLATGRKGIFNTSFKNAPDNLLAAEDKIRSSGLYFPDYGVKTSYGPKTEGIQSSQGVYNALFYKSNPEIGIRSKDTSSATYGHEYGHFIDDMMGTYIPKSVSRKTSFFSDVSQGSGRKIAGGEIGYPNNPPEIFADTYANMVGLPLNYKSGIPIGFPGGRSYIEDQIVKFFERYKQGGLRPISDRIKSVKKDYGAFFASGHDPVFESIKREKMALLAMGYAPGESAKSIKVGQLSTLKNASNPGGFGVYNTLQGQHSLGQAVAQHGGVPNLANKKYGNRRPLNEEELSSARQAKNESGKAKYDEAQAAKKAERDLRKFGSSVQKTTKEVDNQGKVIRSTSTITKSLGDKVKISNVDSSVKTGTISSGGVGISTNRSRRYGPINIPSSTQFGGPNYGPPGLTSTASTGPTARLSAQTTGKVYIPPTPVPPPLPPPTKRPAPAVPRGNPLASIQNKKFNAGAFFDPSKIKIPPQLPLSASVYGAYGPRLQNPSFVRPQLSNAVKTDVLGAKAKADAIAREKQFKEERAARAKQARIDAIDKNGFTKLERRAGLTKRPQEDLMAFRRLSRSDQAVVAKENQQQRNASRSQKAFGASYILPIAGAGISEAFGGQNDRTGRLIGEGANSLASGMSVAALLGGGPIGVGVGAGIAVTSFATSFRKEKYSPEKQAKAFEELQSALESRQNLISGYVTALSNVEDLKSAGASLQKIQKAREQSSQSLLALGAEAEQIINFNGDTEKIANYLGEVQSRSNASISAAALNKGIAEKSASVNSGFASYFKDKPVLEKKDAELFAKGLTSSLSLEGISGSQLRNTANKGSLGVNDLTDLGLDPEVGKEIFSKLSTDFKDGAKDVTESLRTILLSLARYKDLDAVQKKIEENRVSVTARVKDLLDSSNKFFEFQSVKNQGSFAKNIGSAERQLGFFSQVGGGSEESIQKVASSIEELKIQNEYNSKVGELKNSFAKQASQIAGGIKSDKDRAAALTILPKYLSGDLGLTELADSFRNIASSGQEGIDESSNEFRKTMDDLSLAMEKLKQENEIAVAAQKEETALKNKLISIEKLRVFGGAQLSKQDFSKNLSSYVSNINFKGTDTSKFSMKNMGDYRQKLSGASSADADRRIQAYKIAQESGFGIENIADSDLQTRQQRNLKRRKLEERRNTLIPDYESKILENNRQYNVASVTEEFKKINDYAKNNPYGPKVMRKEDQTAILEAIQSGDPSKAGRILKDVKRDNNIENIPQLDELTKGLTDAITEAIASRGLVSKQAETLYNKDFTGNAVPKEIQDSIDAAKSLVDNKQVNSFVADLDKSKVSTDLDAIKKSTATMAEKLAISLNKEKISRALGEAALGQTNAQANIDKFKTLNEALGGKQVFQDNNPVFYDKPGVKISQYAADQIFNSGKEQARSLLQSGKDPLSIKNSISSILGSDSSNGGTRIISPEAGGALEQAILKYAEELKKLQQKTEEKTSLENQLQSVETTSTISLGIQVSANDIIKSSVESPEFKDLVRKFVTENYIASYKESSGGKYPVILPKAIA